jgi:hypothetical protein
MRIRLDGAARIVQVHLPTGAAIYTAFGGDGDLNDLVVGQRAKVWFQACKWPRTGVPVAAYFQIYSKDPGERP